MPSLIDPSLFTPFTSPTNHLTIPEHFILAPDGTPHALCRLAAEELQLHLKTQNEWSHNFGLEENATGSIIGKMFGVLVVHTADRQRVIWQHSRANWQAAITTRGLFHPFLMALPQIVF